MDKTESLPKWAQDEIKRLKSEVEAWKKAARAASSDNASDTNVAILDYSAIHSPNGGLRGLPPNSRIEFRLDDETKIDVNVEDGILCVTVKDGRLAVFPRVSNSIEISRMK